MKMDFSDDTDGETVEQTETGPKPTAQESEGFGRRAYLKRVGTIAAAAGVATAGGARVTEPVGRAEAIAPIVAAGAAAVGGGTAGASAGWLLRDEEIIGSDDPPEGVTEDALLHESYTTARARESTNASTIVDN